MTSKQDIFASPPKALTFDVFGTVVNWRKTVTDTLISSAAAKTSSTSVSASLEPDVRQRLSELSNEDWGRFAQEWRNSYKKFVAGYKPNEDPWRDIDTHHRISLEQLLEGWSLKGLYDENEIEDLSKVWHFLDPWDDSSKGLHLLGDKFVTSSLSNGNRSLLEDLQQHGNLGFKTLQTSADFKAYKPYPTVYLGAAKKLGCEPHEVAMVAAHLSDLRAARGQGFRTVYVERPREEDWKIDSDEYKDAKTWVDVWVGEDEDGFVEVARRFGIS